MKTRKNKQVFTNTTYLINYEAIERIKKQLINLETKKNNLIEKSNKVKKELNNFSKIIKFWVEQNKKWENKIFDTDIQIYKLEQQKINKIKNFFISLFSFGKINKNKSINNSIETEKINCKLFKNTKLNNQKKIDILTSNHDQKQIIYINLITNINKITEDKNKLLETKEKILEKDNYLLINLLSLKEQQEKEKIIEVNEQMVEQFESEIFELREQICDLENQLVSNSSDEGFNSKSTSTDSLYSNISLPLKTQPKLQISKPSNKQKEDNIPWEQTLRKYEYDIPKKHYQEKIKSTKPKTVKL